MGGVISDSAKSAKNLAKQVARQMAREPLEVLRAAGQQVGGFEREAPTQRAGAAFPKEPTPQEKAKIELQGQRQLVALEQEIAEIQKNQQNQAAAKVQQEQAVAIQVQQAKKELPKVPSKRSRKLFGFGQKAQAEKQKTRVEKPLPPSG